LLGRLSRSLVRGPLRASILRGAPDEEIFQALAAADDSAPAAPNPEATA
jgi:hypothetical protein